jgi:hypothetical protein
MASRPQTKDLLALRRTFDDRRALERSFMLDAYLGFFLMALCVPAVVIVGSKVFALLGI